METQLGLTGALVVVVVMVLIILTVVVVEDILGEVRRGQAEYI